MSNLATITSNILADSGIDDVNLILSTGSYADPSWITSLAYSKITGAPAAGIAGTIATGQVAFGTAANIVGGDNGLFWDNTNKRLGVVTNAPANTFSVGSNNQFIVDNIGNVETIMSAIGGELSPSLISPNWTLNAGWAYGSNTLVRTAAGGLRTAFPTSPLTILANNTYRVIITATVTTGGFTILLGELTIGTITSSGTNTLQGFVNSSSNLQFTAISDASVFTISSLSVQRLDSTTGKTILGGPTTFNSLVNMGPSSITGVPVFINGFSVLRSDGFRRQMMTVNSAASSVTLGNSNLTLNINGGDGIRFSANNSLTEQMRLVGSTGNLLLNTTTDAGFRLDVNGTARVQGDLSVTGTNINLLNSNYGLNVVSGTGTLSIRNDVGSAQQTRITFSNGTFLNISQVVSSASGNVSGTFNTITTPITYAWSSGTAQSNLFVLNPTINNTGTYSAIFRGFLYNPTLTSLTGTTHIAIQTVSGDVLLGTTSGNVAIGTSTLATATELTLGGSQTASSGIARGELNNTTLVAAANNDVLVGLDINPTFTNGAFTGVRNLAARISGILAGVTQYWSTGAGANNHYLQITSANSNSANINLRNQGNSSGTAAYYLFNGSARFEANAGTGLVSIGANDSTWFTNLISEGVNVLRIFPSTRNVLIQNGGTFTDAGFRLDVNGTARVQGVATFSSTINALKGDFGSAFTSTNVLQAFAPSATDANLFQVGMIGVSNGFTVQRVSSNFIYSFLDGNVGIGTTNPLFRTDSRDSLIVSNTDPTTSFSSSTGAFYIRGAAAYAMGPNPVTIYPSLWRQQLENIGFFSGTSSLVWATSSNGGAYQEVLRLSGSTGNVLIGSSFDPGARLYVDGSFRTGDLTSGTQTAAVNWRLGDARSGTATANSLIRVEINGVLVDLIGNYV